MILNDRPDWGEVHKAVQEWKHILIRDENMAPIFKAKTREFEERIVLERRMKNYYADEYVQTNEPWLKLALQMQDMRIESWDKERSRFEKYARFTRQTDNRAFEEQVARAKEYDIMDLLEHPVSVYAGRAKFLCPLHAEKSPSFVVFTQENRYYCFGCNSKGDSIDLYQKMNNVSFITAIKNLSQSLG